MEEFSLGPNGGLIYCMEYLLENFEWLENEIKNLDSRYLIIDCPGQVCAWLIIIRKPQHVNR